MRFFQACRVLCKASEREASEVASAIVRLCRSGTARFPSKTDFPAVMSHGQRTAGVAGQEEVNALLFLASFKLLDRVPKSTLWIREGMAGVHTHFTEDVVVVYRACISPLMCDLPPEARVVSVYLHSSDMLDMTFVLNRHLYTSTPCTIPLPPVVVSKLGEFFQRAIISMVEEKKFNKSLYLLCSTVCQSPTIDPIGLWTSTQKFVDEVTLEWVPEEWRRSVACIVVATIPHTLDALSHILRHRNTITRTALANPSILWNTMYVNIATKVAAERDIDCVWRSPYHLDVFGNVMDTLSGNEQHEALVGQLAGMMASYIEGLETPVPTNRQDICDLPTRWALDDVYYRDSPSHSVWLCHIATLCRVHNVTPKEDHLLWEKSGTTELAQHLARCEPFEKVTPDRRSTFMERLVDACEHGDTSVLQKRTPLETQALAALTCTDGSFMMPYNVASALDILCADKLGHTIFASIMTAFRICSGQDATPILAFGLDVRSTLKVAAEDGNEVASHALRRLRIFYGEEPPPGGWMGSWLRTLYQYNFHTSDFASKSRSVRRRAFVKAAWLAQFCTPDTHLLRLLAWRLCEPLSLLGDWEERGRHGLDRPMMVALRGGGPLTMLLAGTRHVARPLRVGNNTALYALLFGLIERRESLRRLLRFFEHDTTLAPSCKDQEIGNLFLTWMIRMKRLDTFSVRFMGENALLRVVSPQSITISPDELVWILEELQRPYVSLEYTWLVLRIPGVAEALNVADKLGSCIVCAFSTACATCNGSDACSAELCSTCWSRVGLKCPYCTTKNSGRKLLASLCTPPTWVGDFIADRPAWVGMKRTALHPDTARVRA